MSSRYSFILCFMAAISTLCVKSHAAAPPPTFDFDSVMNTYFDDTSGLISFDRNIVAFAPDGPFRGSVAVLDPQGQVVKRFPYFDTIQRDGVYGTVKVVGPASVQLTEPGIYTIVYLVDEKPVTRFPVRLHKLDTGDDPFNPEPVYYFDGYWRTHAHLVMKVWKEEKFPEVHFWIGGVDLPKDKSKGAYWIELLRDGEMVAHGKRTLGHISAGHFERTRASLYHPHTQKDSANAELFMLKDWLVDGNYELRVTGKTADRESDGRMIRSFDFLVKDGKFVQLPQTKLDYEPHVDYVTPKVQEKGASTFEMIDAVWIKDGGAGE